MHKSGNSDLVDTSSPADQRHHGQRQRHLASGATSTCSAATRACRTLQKYEPMAYAAPGCRASSSSGRVQTATASRTALQPVPQDEKNRAHRAQE